MSWEIASECRIQIYLHKIYTASVYKYIEYPYVSKNCKIIFLIFKMLYVFAIILFSGGAKNQIYGCHSGRRRYQKRIWMRLRNSTQHWCYNHYSNTFCTNLLFLCCKCITYKKYICRATGMEEGPKVTLDIQCLW